MKRKKIQDFFGELPRGIREEVFTYLATCRNCRKISTSMIFCNTWCDECVSADKILGIFYNFGPNAIEDVCDFMNIRSKYETRTDNFTTKEICVELNTKSRYGCYGYFVYSCDRKKFLNDVHNLENIVGVDAHIQQHMNTIRAISRKLIFRFKIQSNG